jgi:hypothetical protein
MVIECLLQKHIQIVPCPKLYNIPVVYQLKTVCLLFAFFIRSTSQNCYCLAILMFDRLR